MSFCAVVLAAGEGVRLRPMTLTRPKALCPVGGTSLLDLTLRRLELAGLAGPSRVAVNACYLADQVVTHVADRAHLSVEQPPALGTSGAVANLRDWIAGRAVLVCNADAYLAPGGTGRRDARDRPDTSASPPLASPPLASPPLAGGPRSGAEAVAAMLSGWDGMAVRILVTPAQPDVVGEFGDQRDVRFAGMSLLPWNLVKDLPVHPSDLVKTAWRPAEARGELDLVPYRGVFIDCGTPADYEAANLHAEGTIRLN